MKRLLLLIMLFPLALYAQEDCKQLLREGTTVESGAQLEITN